MLVAETLVLYLLIGVGVGVAVYLADGSTRAELGFRTATAVAFWPLYLPILLSRPVRRPPQRQENVDPPQDALTTEILRVEAELDAALSNLDGWAEDVLESERLRLDELRATWHAQAARIRELQVLLASQEIAGPEDSPAVDAPAAAERQRNSEAARRQNLTRLKEVRDRAYDDLLGTLAWVRELVSMIHLAKYTGAPASRAEELVAQIAAAVEGISAVTWQQEDLETASR